MSDINQILNVDYSYSSKDEEELSPILTSLEKRLGGERRPYGGRAGAIDLVTFLEVVISLVASATLGKVLESYFSGLLRTEDTKTIGQQHRETIERWLNNVKIGLQEIVAAIEERLKSRKHLSTFFGKEQPFAIRFQIGQITCYVVINQPHITQEALDILPNAIIRVVRFFAEVGIPEDATVVQLFFDSKSSDWRYLLAPTREGFGHFIDRVIDIKTGEIYSRITSADSFH